MYLNRVVQKSELEKFESSLAEHQKAIIHLYTSIYLEQLAQLLRVVDADKGEKVAAKMILDGSLSGEIDEVEGVLKFFSKSQGNAANSENDESSLMT
eukprot:scaffold165673_cov83-Cyclotella_meneghiniana.AAC.3